MDGIGCVRTNGEKKNFSGNADTAIDDLEHTDAITAKQAFSVKPDAMGTSP